MKALITLVIALSKEWKRPKPNQHYCEWEVENTSRALNLLSRSFNEKGKEKRESRSAERAFDGWWHSERCPNISTCFGNKPLEKCG